MIHKIFSDLKSFKDLAFRPGLNILLSEKSEDSTDLHSRNAAGKTSLVELMHFLLGAESGPKDLFRSNALKAHTFCMDLELGNELYTISRSGKTPSQVLVEGDIEKLPKLGKTAFKGNSVKLTNDEWKLCLGQQWFGLPIRSKSEISRFSPTFRAIIPYFARRSVDEGFSIPTQHSKQQQKWNQQVSLSYLLGLDWRVSQGFEELRAQVKLAQSFRKAANDGDLGQYFSTDADLRTKLAILQKDYETQKEDLDNFQVIKQYHSLEQEASEITRQMEELSNQNFLDKELLDDLRDSLDEEVPPEIVDLENIYKEADVVLPEIVCERIEQSTEFHKAVTRNRKVHLQDEIKSAEKRLQDRNEKINKTDERRREIMSILSSGGALEQYTKLREEVGRLEGESLVLQRQLELVEKITSTKQKLDSQRLDLKGRLIADIQEREEILKDAILYFETFSRSLYEKAGSMTISHSENGPEINIKIEGVRSKGISNMQIFCFDLMLMEMNRTFERGPGFLVHDSHLFDGVDERQVAMALQTGAEYSQKGGYQYIITMNSDTFPSDSFKSGFKVEDYILEQTLSDKTETGGLFGFRFE